MKKVIHIYILVLTSLFLLTTCKNPKIDYDSFSITKENVKPEIHKVVISGEYDLIGEVSSMKLSIGQNVKLIDAESYLMDIDGQSFSVIVDNLSAGSLYYYCYVVEFVDGNQMLTEVGEFTTLSDKPLVKTLEITVVDATSFLIKCRVEDDFGLAITERGIYWNTDGNPGINDHKMKHEENGVGEYVCKMENLEPNTTYYVRAYAKNDTGIGLAQEVLQFETHDNPSDSLMIVIDCNPPSGGTATGGGTFSFGQRCTVTATANEGYAFTQWTENGNQVSTEASYTFTVDRNRTLVANFTQNSYNVTVSANPSNGGTVTGSGDYNYGQLCTVTASAATGYTFTNWTENDSVVSTNTSYTFTVNGNRNLVAHFTNVVQNYIITVSADPSNGGNVTGGGTYQQGQSCTVVAAPAANYTFTNWTENGSVVSTNANYTFAVNSNRTLVAHFTTNTYAINVSANPRNGGTVTGGGTFPSGSIHTVTAIPNTGFTFVNWTENGNMVSTNANYTITVDSDRSFVANFKPSDAIGGVFTINADNDQVYFSKGNLQYKASTGTWRFAEHQWDYVGGTTTPNNVVYGTVYENGVRCSNNKISQTYSGWIDLFGWGTGGNPTNSSSIGSDYSTFTDWGVNSIGNSVNQWRTLTQTEWDYILNEREASSLGGTPNARFAKATVKGIVGLILFPDNYSHPDGIVPPNGINVSGSGSNYSDNDYPDDIWIKMEINGCVFLPVTGRRIGINFLFTVGNPDGYYWSSSLHYNVGNSFGLLFNNNINPKYNGPQYTGHCVRLIYPIQ